MLPTPRSAGLTRSASASRGSTPRPSTPQRQLSSTLTDLRSEDQLQINRLETEGAFGLDQPKPLPSLKSLDLLPSVASNDAHSGDRCVIVEDHIVIERERDTKSRDGTSVIPPWSRLSAGPRFFALNGYMPQFESRRPGTSASATSSISSLTMSMGTSNSNYSESRPGTACSPNSIHAALPPLFAAPPHRESGKSYPSHTTKWDMDEPSGAQEYSAVSSHLSFTLSHPDVYSRPSTSYCSPLVIDQDRYRITQRPSTSSGAFTSSSTMTSPMISERSLAPPASTSRSMTPTPSSSSPQSKPFSLIHAETIISPFELGDLPRIPTNLFVPPRIPSEPTDNDREAAEILAAVAGLTSCSNSSASSAEDERTSTTQVQVRPRASSSSDARAHQHADPRDVLFRAESGRNAHCEREPAYHPYASQHSRAGPALHEYYRHSAGGKMLHPPYAHVRPVHRAEPYPRPIDAYEAYMDQRRRASLGDDEALRLQKHLSGRPIKAGELYRQASWESQKHLSVPEFDAQSTVSSVSGPNLSVAQPKVSQRGLQETAADGDRPFACPGCDRTFARRYDRNRHARKHTGEKPYVCGNPECGEEFGRPDALQRHYRASAQCEAVRAARKRKVGPAPASERGSIPHSDHTGVSEMDRYGVDECRY